MDKQQAKDIVRGTLEKPFDKGQFTHFIRNLLNHLDESEKARFINQGNYIPDAYKQYISSLERIGKYSSGDHKIDILIVKLKKETSIERARTMQRNFIARYLNGSRGGEMKEAALVAFVSPDSEDWRFSLVKMDYRLEDGKNGKVKIKDEFTPARRWSFLVGQNENSHTAQTRLLPIMADDGHPPTLAELEEAFNIEIVTKEFFIEYRNLFIGVKESLDKIIAKDEAIKINFEKNDVNTVDFAKKLLGQIVFLYFLQKKGWFGVAKNATWGTGSKQFLRELFDKKNGDYKNFFNDILEPLFYEALRLDRSHEDHYYRLFDCKIPFLNGGLFDPIKGYDWVNTDIILPDELFSNKNRTKEGDAGNGILDIFDRYNFTVKEDEPMEKEVAIDPELLGKTYEKFNAIRPDNFEEYRKALKSGKKGEESKFNKQFGVYYTPREIVHYMCQQSLINYLAAQFDGGAVIYEKPGDEQTYLLGNIGKKGQLDLTIEHTENLVISKEDIEKLIHLGERLSENEELALIKQQKINEGHQKTSDYKLQLPESIRNNAKAIDGKLASVKICDPAIGSGAFPVGMMSEIVRTRNVLSNFINDDDRTIYKFKRDCIENSLYGVDIDPGAVEIAKLRLWLSLVVDEDDIKNIKPLPNLDYKIVCGNSLMGVEKNLFNEKLFRELEKVKPFYFNETNPTKKQNYKNKIDELINKITSGHSDFDFEVYFSEVFHKKGGFDVVIGNPPYISHDKIPISKNLLKQKYHSYEPFADIYCFFMEKGLSLQNKKGNITFITSNSYLRAEYGMPIRRLIRKENEILSIISLENTQIFEDAIVNVAIILSSRIFMGKQGFIFNQSLNKDISGFAKYVTENGFYYNQEMFDSKSWSLIEPRKILIQQKIEKNGKSLEQLGAKIRLGLATGNNDAFVIDDYKRKEFIKLNRKNAEIIKPILRGRDIFRYSYKSPNLFIFLTKNGLNIKKDYPDIYKYLDGFGESFKKRGAQGQHWTNLRAVAFFDDFKKEKIVWIELSDIGRFALCEDETYLLNTAYFLLPPQKIGIKYLLGILNSKLMYFYLGLIAETSGMGVSRWINNYVKEFPIVQVDDDKQNQISKLVDDILFLKKENEEADTSKIERNIDHLVYKLYDLTQEEIKIVEGRAS